MNIKEFNKIKSKAQKNNISFSDAYKIKDDEWNKHYFICRTQSLANKLYSYLKYKGAQPKINGKEVSTGLEIDEYWAKQINEEYGCVESGLIKDSIKDVNPRSEESKSDFIARFMEETKGEYPDEKQRLAVAYSYWKSKGKDSINDSMESEVKQWWSDVEKWNRENGYKFDIDNTGASAEDMLIAMFDMIPDLRGVNNQLYNNGKRIYNKYSKYSQYRDNVKDSEPRYILNVFNIITERNEGKYASDYYGRYDSEKILRRFFAKHPEYDYDNQYFVSIEEYYGQPHRDSLKQKAKDFFNVKDSYYIVACEEGDYWFDENGKPNTFEKAKKYKSYEEANKFRLGRGEGSVQKIDDSIKDDDWDFLHKIRNFSQQELKNALKTIVKSKLYKELEDDGFRYANIGKWLDAKEKDALLRKLDIKDSIKDEDIEELSKEEQQAIDDYKKAISGTTDVKLLELYSHILREEIEHLRELNEAKTNDSIKDGWLEEREKEDEQRISSWNKKDADIWRKTTSEEWRRNNYTIKVPSDSFTKDVRVIGSNEILRGVKFIKVIYNNTTFPPQYVPAEQYGKYRGYAWVFGSNYKNGCMVIDRAETWDMNDRLSR